MSRITVALCTYDRYSYLADALAGLARQTLAPGDYRILVVDNSPDRATAEDFAGRHRGVPNLDYRFADQPGLSNARNAALAACASELIAFIDDDAIARPAWLERLVEAFDALGPAAAVVGGTVELLWPAPRPPWLSDTLLSHLSAVNWGGQRRQLQPPEEWLVGTNIAYRRDALAAVGGFSPFLGRYGHGGALLSNEEVDTVDRMRAAGGMAFFEPAAIVDHTVHPDRLTPAWFRRRVAWQEISEAIARTRNGTGMLANGADAGGDQLRVTAAVAAALAAMCRPTDDPEQFQGQIFDIGALIKALINYGMPPEAPARHADTRTTPSWAQRLSWPLGPRSRH